MADKCFQKGCNEEEAEAGYCDKHYEFYYCECGQKLEDWWGTAGDGLCVKCR
jgi:hypothetical protein